MLFEELKRLNAVRKYDEFNFNLSKGLEDVLTLATELCKTPVAFITLVDEDVQYFKVTRGMDVSEMPRATSFCNRTIAGQSVLVVPDPTKDERFKDLPLVMQPPHIRFYAGASLTTGDGLNIGTLCVYDGTPKELSPSTAHMLEILAKQAMHLMELELCLQILNKKNEHITAQSQALMTIAFTQAHEFRGPLSTAMGFMQMIKDDDYKAEKEDLMMMEQAMNKLDEKIHLVVQTTQVAEAIYTAVANQ
jgi:GAF domain-containing protein